MKVFAFSYFFRKRNEETRQDETSQHISRNIVAESEAEGRAYIELSASSSDGQLVFVGGASQLLSDVEVVAVNEAVEVPSEPVSDDAKPKLVKKSSVADAIAAVKEAAEHSK